MKRTIVLLSGGMDSTVSLAYALRKTQIIQVLTFDYGQKPASQEITSARKLTQKFSLPLKIINLDWFTELVSSRKKVWVPNRNGLFINIGACFAEALGAHQIITGFDQEEAQEFPDNSRQFVKAINKSLWYSTLSKVKVKSFVIKMNKAEIVKAGLKLGVAFEDTWSCYQDTEKMCGRCISCQRAKQAYRTAGQDDLVKRIFLDAS